MARRGEAIILTYHRVIEKWDRTLDYSQPGMVVTADTFDRQLTFLKKCFDIVPLSSLVNSKFEIRNSKPRCVITFDDGWRDNFEIAFPILRKYGVPATIFLTTDFIGTNRAFWHTRLIYVVLHGDFSNEVRIRRILKAYPAGVRHYLMRLVTMTDAPCVEDLGRFIEAVKARCNEDTIEELITDLARTGRVRRPFLSDRQFFLDWNQVREMAAAGHEIGSHGCSHRILTRLKTEEAEEEFLRSKAVIQTRIGKEVHQFAFPDGAANQTLVEAAGNAGYKIAFVRAPVFEGPLKSLGLQRGGMHEEVSVGGDGSFSEPSLSLWLLRVPKMGVV
jgi:peptidoglycan/xylan/chitin deacetylase (PgdA/CDA1 family)